jgi:NAD(P)-dependent dehydrogenase (short-subunit alcohol dehydrogenase family)
MSRFSGRVAVVTGGANGLGEPIAPRLSEEGAAIAILDRDERGQDVAEKLAGGGAPAVFQQVDVTQEAPVEAPLAAVSDQLGRIDVRINNAGVLGADGPADKFELAEWERVFAVNCTAVFQCTKHAIPHLRRADGGSIVNISSIHGLIGGGDIPPYHASKGAVRVMSKDDALTYAPENIRVDYIHPGIIFTDMVFEYVDNAGMDRAQARPVIDGMHPLNGSGTPHDIAWGVAYFASDHARRVTGAELVIDGCYTAR